MNTDTHLLISFLAFFTFVIASFVLTFLDRRRIRKELANPSGKLISPNDRIVVNRKILLIIGIGLTLFGGHSVLFIRINKIYMIAVSLMLVVGVFILLFLLFKRTPSGWLQFSKKGLTIGLRSGSYTVPWTAFQSWEVGEIMRNQVVLIILKEPIIESFRIESNDPNLVLRVQKIFAQNFSLIGAHVMITLGIWKASTKDIVYTIREYTK